MDVKIIKIDQKAALVEWLGADDYPRRGVLPAVEIEDGHASEAALEAAIPGGAPWETILTPAVTVETLAGELRRAGIWDIDDLYAPGGAARALAAIQSAYGIDLAVLLQAAKQLRGEQNG